MNRGRHAAQIFKVEAPDNNSRAATKASAYAARVMMGHENFDNMCERYQDAKAAGDNVDGPKTYTAKPERNPNR